MARVWAAAWAQGSAQARVRVTEVARAGVLALASVAAKAQALAEVRAKALGPTRAGGLVWDSAAVKEPAWAQAKAQGFVTGLEQTWAQA